MTIRDIERFKNIEEERLTRTLEKMADQLIIPLAKACKKDVPDLQHIIWGMGSFSIRGTVTFTYKEPGFSPEEVTQEINECNFERGSGWLPFYPPSLVKLWEACQALNNLDLSPSKDIILRDL